MRWRGRQNLGQVRSGVQLGHLTEPGARDWVASQAAIDLAGMVAEAISVTGYEPGSHNFCDDLWDDRGGDVGGALQWLSEVEELEDRRWRWALRIVEQTEKLMLRPDVRSAIETLAEKLLDGKPTLGEDELYDLTSRENGLDAMLAPCRTMLERQQRRRQAARARRARLQTGALCCATETSPA